MASRKIPQLFDLHKKCGSFPWFSHEENLHDFPHVDFSFGCGFPMWILSHDFFPLKPEMDMIKHPIFQHPSPTECPRQVLTVGRRFGRVGQLGNGEARLNGSSWRKGEWACETNSKLTRIPISKIMIGFLTNKHVNQCVYYQSPRY